MKDGEDVNDATWGSGVNVRFAVNSTRKVKSVEIRVEDTNPLRKSKDRRMAWSL